MPSNHSAIPARRQRSAIACQACRQRKVRCSLTVTGVPCVSCTQYHTECVVDPKRGKKDHHNRAPVIRTLCQSSSDVPASNPHHHNGIPLPSTTATNHRDDTFSSPGFQIASEETTSIGERTSLLNEGNNIEDEERNGLEIAAAAIGQPQRVGQVPFYTGENTGLTSTLDICLSDQPLSRHLLIPSDTSRSLPDEDRNYLEMKGVFTLPGSDTCSSLLRAYFYHVHPIMPVIEADLILSYYQSGRLHEYNLLLLWSVFLVAVNFIPAHIYEQEGYKSRKEMKAVMYSRAKCMYNNSGERDKIVLLQSSLLMGFWHSDLDEHMQPLYWTGIAISLCRILGLHRDPDSSKYNSSITDRQRHLWRRLWWSCYFRDCCLSLTLGRPLRINLNDCDTPMPSAADLISEIDEIQESISTAYLPTDFSLLANYWVSVIELSKLLSAVITMNYQKLRPRPALHQIEALEADILQYKLPDQYGHGLTRLATFYSYHIQLQYQALLISFYRPYASEIPDGLDITHRKDWQRRMRLKASLAASQTNGIIDALVQGNLLEFAEPITPPLLVPAMQTHLLDCKSVDPLSRRLGLNKLDACMLVMEEFQKTYTVASIYRGIFMKAIQQLFPDYSPSASTSNTVAGTISGPIATDSATADAPVLNGPVIDAPNADNLLDALMDEASIFNFWEALNGI